MVLWRGSWGGLGWPLGCLTDPLDGAWEPEVRPRDALVGSGPPRHILWAYFWTPGETLDPCCIFSFGHVQGEQEGHFGCLAGASGPLGGPFGAFVSLQEVTWRSLGPLECSFGALRGIPGAPSRATSDIGAEASETRLANSI